MGMMINFFTEMDMEYRNSSYLTRYHPYMLHKSTTNF